MKFSTLLRIMRFWPPFMGAGISVQDFSSDYLHIVVQMKMRFWNRNYVGTHFGGSMYAMTDPFYMLMLLKFLGKNYIVWDKSASIHYKQPGKGTLYAHFDLSIQQIESIRQELEEKKKINPEFIIPITNQQGVVVAEVKKVLSIAKK